MTVTADAKKRVVLPAARPGDVFELRVSGDGQFVLTRMEPVKNKPANVRFVKRDGYTVALSDQPINEAAIKELLADFP